MSVGKGANPIRILTNSIQWYQYSKEDIMMTYLNEKALKAALEKQRKG